MKKKVLILVNHNVVIYNFRRELVERLVNEGYEVHLSCPNGNRIPELVNMGCIFSEVELERHGTNPLSELKLLKYYKSIMKNIQPDVILSYTIKPNIYGGIAAAKLKIPYIANITGLGTAVEHKGLLQKVLIQLYRYSFRSASCIFMQNEGNKQFFLKNNIAKEQLKLIPGSGVNLEQYKALEYPKDTEKIRFAFVARVMKDKGVEELLSSFELLKKKYGSVELYIAGMIDEKKYIERLEKLNGAEGIHYLGHCDDITELMSLSHVIVLPSYHEGLSNVLLEGAATGRPVIASDVPGCRETFDDTVSGFACEVKNATSLFEKMEEFVLLPHEEKVAMGIAGRKKVEQEFDRNIVVNTYIHEINNIVGR